MEVQKLRLTPTQQGRGPSLGPGFLLCTHVHTTRRDSVSYTHSQIYTKGTPSIDNRFHSRAQTQAGTLTQHPGNPFLRARTHTHVTHVTQLPKTKGIYRRHPSPIDKHLLLHGVHAHRPYTCTSAHTGTHTDTLEMGRSSRQQGVRSPTQKAVEHRHKFTHTDTQFFPGSYRVTQTQKQLYAPERSVSVSLHTHHPPPPQKNAPSVNLPYTTLYCMGELSTKLAFNDGLT